MAQGHRHGVRELAVAASIQTQRISSFVLCLLCSLGHLLLRISEAFLCCLLLTWLAQHCIWLWILPVRKSHQPSSSTELSTASAISQNGNPLLPMSCQTLPGISVRHWSTQQAIASEAAGSNTGFLAAVAAQEGPHQETLAQLVAQQGSAVAAPAQQDAWQGCLMKPADSSPVSDGCRS